jgi:mannose-6-phosphate isomerase-like protein (cupin superfamily)
MASEHIDLFAPSGLRLHPGGIVEVETPPRMTGQQDDWMVASFHAESDHDVHGDYWEIHPAGQEVVSVLSGHVRLVLRAESEDLQDESVTLATGTAYVVPQNRWHRLEVDGPTDLQSITSRRGTRLERRA